MPLSAAEAARRAIAQAEAEGLKLVRSKNAAGFVGVQKNHAGRAKPYKAQVSRENKNISLGQFATAEEAALVRARAAAEHAAAAAAQAEVPMTAEEAERLAEAEGLKLVRAANNVTVFKGVIQPKPGQRKLYQAKLERGGKAQHLGSFATAEEAALAYARALGPEECAAAAAAQAVVPMTTAEAQSKAEEEGLELVRSDNTTGFVGVLLDTRYGRTKPYQAGGKQQHLGYFATAEEAALVRARFLATGVPNVASVSKRRRPRPDPRRAAALANWSELLNAVAASDAASPPPKKRKQQADEPLADQPAAAPITTEAAVQVGAVETLMQKAARIKVQLGIGPEITTAIAILRAANEAMGLPAEGTLPAQADRLLAAIGI